MKYIFSVLLILLSFFCGTSAAAFSEPDSLMAARGDSLGAEKKVQLNAPREADTTQSIPWHQMITRIPEDYSSFFKTTFSSKALPVVAGLAALTGLLMTVDEPLGSWSHSLVHKSEGYNRFSRLMVEFGDGRYHFLFAGALSLYGISAGDSRALSTASNIAEGIIASGIVVQVLKRITGRQSPEASGNDAGEWRLLPNPQKYQRNQPKYYAFPSGHITTASLTVTVLANNYPEIKWIRPVGYALVGGLGIGLMSKGMHWISDLPLGILLGYTFGNIVAPEKRSSPGEATKGGLSVLPLFSPDSYSLMFAYRF